MLEEQIEYFRGNRQEIENEKQRKRELILHFSNILGTVDKTRKKEMLKNIKYQV